jgi:Predicted nucleotide-binding protein containing TIR-like domain
MSKPRIFLGSSGQQTKLVDALAASLADVAEVEPWTTTFNPGRSTLDRLLELTKEVDFAAFAFASDDWTTSTATSTGEAGQSSPRDNVVFEAGLFGGVLGLRRTFILQAEGTKLPTDLLGLTAVRYAGTTEASEMEDVTKKLRGAIDSEGRIARIEGSWWQFSLTQGSLAALSLLQIARNKLGALEISGRAWHEDGGLAARYWSQAAKDNRDAGSVFYYFRGERPRDSDVPQFEGTGELTLESEDRASGYFTTRFDKQPAEATRTSGIYLRADAEDAAVLEGTDNQLRAKLIADRLDRWRSLANG